MKTKNKIIIIILIILALFLLAEIVAPYYFRCIEKTRWDSALPRMTPIESAIDAYKLNTGHLPGKLEDLVTCPAGLESLWTGPYLKLNHLNDPWDRKYIYNIYPGGYSLISFGNDGFPGGKESNADIYNGYRK